GVFEAGFPKELAIQEGGRRGPDGDYGKWPSDARGDPQPRFAGAHRNLPGRRLQRRQAVVAHRVDDHRIASVTRGGDARIEIPHRLDGEMEGIVRKHAQARRIDADLRRSHQNILKLRRDGGRVVPPERRPNQTDSHRAPLSVWGKSSSDSELNSASARSVGGSSA